MAHRRHDMQRQLVCKLLLAILTVPAFVATGQRLPMLSGVSTKRSAGKLSALQARDLWIDPSAQPASKVGWNVIISIVCSGKFNTVGAIYLRASLALLGFPSDPTRMAFGGNAAMAGWRYTASYTVNIASARSEADALNAVAGVTPQVLQQDTKDMGQEVIVESVFFSAYQPDPNAVVLDSPPPRPRWPSHSPPPPSPPPPSLPATPPSLPPPPTPPPPPPPTPPPPPPFVPIARDDFAPPPDPSTTMPPPPPPSPSPPPPPLPAAPSSPSQANAPDTSTALKATAVFVAVPTSTGVTAQAADQNLCPALRAAVVGALTLAGVAVTELNDASGCQSITATPGSTTVYYKTMVIIPQNTQRVLGKIFTGSPEVQASFLAAAQVVCTSRVVLLDVESGVMKASLSAANAPYLTPGGGCALSG